MNRKEWSSEPAPRYSLDDMPDRSRIAHSFRRCLHGKTGVTRHSHRMSATQGTVMKRITRISAAGLLALSILGTGSTAALTSAAVALPPTVEQSTHSRGVPAATSSTTWDITTGAFVMWNTWGKLSSQNAYIVKGGSFVSNGTTGEGTVTLGVYGTTSQDVTLPIAVTAQSATSITATLQQAGQPPLTLQLGNGSNGVYDGQAVVLGQEAALVDAFTICQAAPALT